MSGLFVDVPRGSLPSSTVSSSDGVPRASIPVREHSTNFDPVREFDIGYIMGLVVGEGSFTADRRQPYLQVKLHVRDPFPLRHLADRLGGRVYGPYRHQTRHYYTWLLRTWLLRGPALRAAIPIFRALLARKLEARAIRALADPAWRVLF